MNRGVDFLKLVEAANDLSGLIAIGTVNFHSLPTQSCALQGIVADEDGWKWLDYEFLTQSYQGHLHPVFRALAFLLRYKYLAATYKVFQLYTWAHLPPIAMARVRVYAIPLDREGARYLRQWRRKWLDHYLAREFKRHWLTLLKALDYSPSGWQGSLSHSPITDFVTESTLILPLNNPEEYTGASRCPSTFHFSRWLHQQPYFLAESLEEPSLEVVVLRIYNNVSVPDVSRYENRKVTKKLGLATSEDLITSLLDEYPANNSVLPGITSTLYPFQVKSLCKMLEKETVVLRVPVPYFNQLVSPTGKTYYFDMLDSGFYQNAELYTSPRGGILAENMGLGKTLICLSLICVSKFDISTVPHDMILYHDQSVRQSQTTLRRGMKSLADICQDTIIQNSLPWKFFKEDLPQSVVDRLSSKSGFFRVGLNNSNIKHGSRLKENQQEHDHYHTLYLCNSTLLVVPENLFHQWNHELNKHVDPLYLKKLFVSDRFKRPIHSSNSTYTDTIPESVNELLSYDLVLITAPLFAKLFRSTSTLRELYWKRLIIDEGHSMTSKSSNLSVLCNSTFAERRWAVTGTPLSGLTNLYMDEEEQTSEQRVEDSPSKKKRKYVVKSKFNVRDDLVKLGTLVGSFFKVEPFHSQSKLWNSAIVKNLSASIFSTEENLKSLLDSLMVRHSLTEVESDLKLPQLHHEAVFIAPSYHNKLSINLFTAVLAVNAVSSEREGSDYMFDPSNRQQLRRVVRNLQLSTFYWTGFQYEDVKTLIGIANHCLEKKNPDGQPTFGPEDRSLLQRSLAAAHEAIRNPRWRTASMLHEMQYFIKGLPYPFIKTYGLGMLENSGLGVFGAPQVAAIQEFYYKNRFMDMDDEASLFLKLESGSHKFWENYWNDSARTDHSKFKKQESVHDFDVHGLKEALEDDLHPKRDFKLSPSRSSRSQDWNSTRDSLSREQGGIIDTGERKMAYPRVSGSDVRKATFLGSSSAKLSYLASRLVDHQRQGVKSIVFFEFEDSAYYLTELLDILGVNYILYATFIGAGQRSNNLADFDSHHTDSLGGITLIMDLRLASHGLTIISATRVYFLSPVWQRTVEAQAIKRAHRIGQTHKVYVETLVLQNTLEEEIYRRRERERDDPQQEKSDSSRQYVIDDMGMQQFILKHQFLSTSQTEPEYATFSALDLNKSEDMHPDENADSLLSHRSARQLQHLHWQKYWTMHLFNPDNLQKLNAAKKQKASLDQLNSELVEGKPQMVTRKAKPQKRMTVRF